MECTERNLEDRRQRPLRVNSEANSWTQLQFLEWPLEADCSGEPIPMDVRVKMTDFRAEIQVYSSV